MNDTPDSEEVVPCNCPKPVIPMQEWVTAKDQEGCRPCVIGPVVQWYWDELKGRGYQEKADKLGKMAENLDEENYEQIIGICKEFDDIKEDVSEAARERLKDFDCELQSLDLVSLSEEIQDGA